MQARVIPALATNFDESADGAHHYCSDLSSSERFQRSANHGLAERYVAQAGRLGDSLEV